MFDNDTSHEGVKRRIREEMARHGISSDAQAAKRYGRPQQWLQRHMGGDTDWKLAELRDFCGALGLDYTYVLTGIRTLEPNGGLTSPSPRSGVETQPRRYRGSGTNGIRIISAIHDDSCAA